MLILARTFANPTVRKWAYNSLIFATCGVAAVPRVKARVIHELSAISRVVLRLRAVPYDSSRHRVALIVSPHPDDETIGCGGIMIARRELGLETHIVLLTNGQASHAGHPKLDVEELSRLRRNESRRAVAALAGPDAKIHFLNYSDGELDCLTPEKAGGLVDSLAALIERLKPGEILIPCFAEGSSEHDASHRYAVSAVARISPRPRVLEYVVWGLRNPFHLLSAASTARAVYRCGLGSRRSDKRRALRMYRTQVDAVPPWTDPILSKSLVSLFDTGEEFFLEHTAPLVTRDIEEPGDIILSVNRSQ
jgi:LmbE family N-acetylglucosaminyl deacetylase